MDNLIGLLITIYVIASVITSFVKRMQQGPVREEWSDEEPVWEHLDMPEEQTPHVPPLPPVLVSTLDESTQKPTFRPTTATDPAGIHEEPLEPVSQTVPDIPERPMERSWPESRPRTTFQAHPLQELLATRDGVRQGILLAEVLGPPRSKRRSHRL